MYCLKIGRVIIAGNSVSKKIVHKVKKKNYAKLKKNMSVIDKTELLPIEELDIILKQLSSSIPVDIMPGENDPAHYLLPQKPMHSSLFPESSQFKNSTFNSVTNPYRLVVLIVSSCRI